MKKPEFLNDFNFKNEAEYKIVVQGALSPEWSNRLGNMLIEVVGMKSGKTYTSITGKITDQAALSGVLNTLYDLRMTVVSVNLISPKDN
jgi:hypothetical protein